MTTDLDVMILEMLTEAESYCRANKIKLTTLGRFIVNDGSFFENLRDSGNCTIKTYRRVMRWFADKRDRGGRTLGPLVSDKLGNGKLGSIGSNPKKELNQCFSS